MYAGDYDQRTTLHLAAAEGHIDALKILVDNVPDDRNKVETLASKDRWNGTPLDDAISGGHQECADLLLSWGVKASAEDAGREEEGDEPHAAERVPGTPEEEVVVSADAPRMLFAAAENDVDELIKLAASGADLTHGDYDQRTAAHLAASNGHLEALKYILVQSGSRASNTILAKDRFGNSALDDARRNGFAECVAVLENQLEQ